ncbi:MAG TPA: LysE family translocator [Gaiellaceae bacterium]|nr:LysE family translocator [Gaiellaceae bacterium]
MTFLLVALVVIVTPGQDTALTIRNTLVGGRRDGVLTAAGVAAGQATWALAAAGGVAAVIVASEPAFLALRVVGAAYLVWLGVRSLVAAWRRKPHVADRPVRRAPLRQGVLSNLGNPKIAVFFTSLLPQFATSFPSLLAHAIVFVALTFAWLTFVAHVGGALARVRRVVEAVTGAVLIALGLHLAGARR